jgi:hypothetical protein
MLESPDIAISVEIGVLSMNENRGSVLGGNLVPIVTSAYAI